MKKILLCVLFSFVCLGLWAQRYSVATNLVEWGNLGTINGEAGVSVSRHLSLHAGFRYNDWLFRKSDPDDRLEDPFGDEETQFQNKKQAYALTLRWWPWHIYSGWWGYVRGQYMEYNRGGLIRHSADEGDAFGFGVGVGYTYMLHKNWNIEFGAGQLIHIEFHAGPGSSAGRNNMYPAVAQAPEDGYRFWRNRQIIPQQRVIQVEGNASDSVHRLSS